MRSIDSLALDSVVCGGVSLALFCLSIFASTISQSFLNTRGGSVAEKSMLLTWDAATLGVVTLGLAALSRGEHSREWRGAVSRLGCCRCLDIALG